MRTKERLLLHFTVIASTTMLATFLENRDDADEVLETILAVWRRSLEHKSQKEVERLSKEYAELGLTGEIMGEILNMPSVKEREQGFMATLDEVDSWLRSTLDQMRNVILRDGTGET